MVVEVSRKHLNVILARLPDPLAPDTPDKSCITRMRPGSISRHAYSNDLLTYLAILDFLQA